MKDVLRAIDRGETVTVLYRGKERAKLTPIAPASGSGAPKTKDQPLFGLWKDREYTSDPASYLRRLRLPRPALAQTGIEKQQRLRKSK
jgi:antitoxin (DNA-binding transcriptional repressor) of toxin-antitoxin stability system